MTGLLIPRECIEPSLDAEAVYFLDRKRVVVFVVGVYGQVLFAISLLSHSTSLQIFGVFFLRRNERLLSCVKVANELLPSIDIDWAKYFGERRG